MQPMIVPLTFTPFFKGHKPAPRFVPLRSDRDQRFTLGDEVVVARGGFTTGPTRVTQVAADAHPKEFAHCSGRSAKYRLQGVDGWVYDWMLNPAPTLFLRAVRGLVTVVEWAGLVVFFLVVLGLLRALVG